MEDENRKILVKNRSAATVIINIPNRNIKLTLQPGQVVNSLTFADMKDYSYQPGGETILKQYLQLSEADIKDLDFGEPQLEYNYSEQDIINLLNPATPDNFDAFLDCLDFAPTGVIDLIKKYAVSLPVTDTRKLEAIKEQTGFDAAAAIRHVEEEKEEKPEETKTPTRRVVSEPKKTTTGRRVVTPSK